jgi:hypothetical protein
MPARRGKNLRSGDLTENLGLYMIQSLALVAPVPRTEDVGIDIVSTLISEDGKYYLAEDSFYVQIKSSSVTEIIYDKEGVKWLYDLKLPLFIASVDRKKSSVKLFSTKRLFDAFAIEKDRCEIRLVLDEEDSYKIYDFVEKDCSDIYIGPAIMEWSVNQLMNQEIETRNLFYNLLKQHIRIIHESMELQEIGASITYTWKINKTPIFFSHKYSSNINIDFEKLKDRTLNNFHKLLDLSSRYGLREVFDEVYEDLKDYEEVYLNYEKVRNISYKMGNDDNEINDTKV